MKKLAQAIDKNRVTINAQVLMLYAQKMQKMHSILAKCVPGMQEKSSENLSN